MEGHRSWWTDAPTYVQEREEPTVLYWSPEGPPPSPSTHKTVLVEEDLQRIT